MFHALPQTYAPPQQSPSPPVDTMLLAPDNGVVFNGRVGGQKPRKMRASCDACSRAKVKCDKARPICHRCTNMNMCCNYSPSMRLGKPRKNRHSDERPVFRDVSPAGSNTTLGSRSDIISRANIYTAESSPEPTDAFFLCPATPEYHYQDTLMANGFMGGQSPDFSDGSLVSGWSNEEQVAFGAAADIFTTMPQYLTSHATYGGHVRSDSAHSRTEVFPPVEAFYSPPIGVDPFHSVRDPGTLQQDKMMASPPPMACAPLPTPPLSSTHMDTTRHDCTQYVFRTLNHLYAPPQSRPSTAGAQDNTDRSPTWKDILSTTKSSIDELGTLLDCPCSANPLFSTTIACAITKILFWYRSIAGPDDQSNILTGCTRMEPVTHTSNPIRKLNPDTDNKANLRTNTVLSELKRVEKLINKFSMRYFQTANPAETGIESGIYGALEAQLRGQVRDTFQVVMRTAPEEVRRQIAFQSQNRARVHTM